MNSNVTGDFDADISRNVLTETVVNEIVLVEAAIFKKVKSLKIAAFLHYKK